MRSPPARRLYPRPQSQRLEDGADDAGCLDNLFPRDGRAGIEISDNPVGALNVIDR
jgi:hypothetical protein